MVMCDGERRYVEVNRAARLAFRLSLDQMRRYTVDDLTPPHLARDIEQSWTRLLDAGCVAGRIERAGPDGDRLDIIYLGIAHVLPGLHLGAFAPAGWPEHELDPTAGELFNSFTSLTPREDEVLALAAAGYSGRELAHELVLSPATVNTHFKRIYQKLCVRTRAAAVAKAMRLGVID
jgi:DNA-binding CsgD family transcriptional regulator